MENIQIKDIEDAIVDTDMEQQKLDKIRYGSSDSVMQLKALTQNLNRT